LNHQHSANAILPEATSRNNSGSLAIFAATAWWLEA